MADDPKAGLLCAFAGLALKEYVDPIALLITFGIAGVAYVAFRFYTYW